MRARERREGLRAILARNHCTVAPGVFDPLSGRIADDLGFEVGHLGGSIATFAVLGAPDVAIITLSEFAEQARRICRACKLSLMVDADHGFGNALNVMRTVEEMEFAGVSGLTIEDTLLPRAFGAAGGEELISLEEGVGKIKAALAARTDSSLAIMARSSAIFVTGIDDAVKRLTAYQAAGADALFLPHVRNRAELDRAAAAAKVPIVLGGADETVFDPDYLVARGVRIWMGGQHPYAAAVQAVYDSMKSMRGGALSSQLKNLAAKELMDRLAAAPRYDQWIKKFLSNG